MAQVYVSAGSNSNRQQNIALALARLKRQFGPLTLSPVYESPPADGRGDNYFNLAIGFQTALSPAELREQFRYIESELGRERASESVSIDLDLLLYDDLAGEFDDFQLPHPDLSRHRHVLQPLVDIAAEVRFPGSGQSLRDLLGTLPAAGAIERVSNRPKV